MPSPRRIAVMFDGDHLSARESQTLRGIARYADAVGWRIVLDYYAIFHPSAEWDGVIAPFRKGVRKPIERCPVPVVCVSWSRTALRAARVVGNRHEAGRLAARHLVERGYRSFAYIGFTLQGQSFFERHEFAHELGRMGRGVATARTFASYARTRGWWEKVMSALGTLVSKLTPPMGFFVARPGLARCVADLALDRGLRVPQDVGIISADDEPAVCDVAPGLTSLHYDYAELGYRAAEQLDRLIAGEPLPERATLISPSLVPRCSTDRLASGDSLVAQALWFIDSRRTESIGPADVASALGVSERTLQRRLRRAGRATIVQEIAKARVEHAKILLADLQPDAWPDRPGLSAIARRSGFSGKQALWRAFKEHVGMPPDQWRREALLARQGAEHPEMPQLRRRRKRRKRHGPRGS